MTTVELQTFGVNDYPTLPLLPFVDKPKRYHSAWSSTACGTPTPHNVTPHHGPLARHDLTIPVNRKVIPISEENWAGECGDSPRIQRSATNGIEPELYSPPIPPTPACGRLYEYRCPPIPRADSVYKQAKKAEYEGDFEKAMNLYLLAIEKRDRSDSAIKDYAGLLHMRGRTQEAIDFLEKCSKADLVRSSAGFKNLINQLKAYISNFSAGAESERRDLPRQLYVAVGEDLRVRICLSSLSSLFPNHLKVSRIVYINPLLDDQGRPFSDRALIEFASHSAARKALLVNKHSALKCFWASDSMLESDPRIVTINPDKTSLAGTGPAVKTVFAIVPADVVEVEWPKLIQAKANQDDSIDTKKVSGSALQLPVMKRCNRPVELDMGVIEGNSGFVLEMHWCLDTPSPIRSVACLL